MPLLAENCSGTEREHLRYVGKHSKNMGLSLYLQKRQIYETELAGSAGDNGFYCEPLQCIVRVAPEQAAKIVENSQCVVIGVLARLSCDIGLAYNEFILYQVETRLPLDKFERDSIGMVGEIFDFASSISASVPDQWHIPFGIQLPGGLPPSVYFKNPSISSGNWGLTWYVFSYVANEHAVLNTQEKHGHNGIWPRLRLGRRHCKVFLSFSKLNVCSYERISQNIPPSIGMNKRRSFLSSGHPLILEASLDKSVYFAGERVRVTLKIRNHGKQKISGIRITMKQLVTIRFGSEQRQVLKNTIAEHEGQGDHFSEIKEYDTNDILIEILPSVSKPNYQIALECRLPRTIEGQQKLSPSTLFTGLSWASKGSSFGIDKLRIFSVEYYVNVHVVIPWSGNLIVKLPFQLAGSLEETSRFAAKLPQLVNNSSLNSVLDLGKVEGTITAGFETKSRPIYKNRKQSDNLLAFNSDGEQASDEDFDLENEPILPLFPRTSAQTNRNPTASNNEPLLLNASGHLEDVLNGVSWSEDIRLATKAMRFAQSDLTLLQKNVLANKLDRRTLSLQNSEQRTAMNWRLLEVLSSLLLQDLPRLKTAISIVMQGGNSVTRFAIAQNTSDRLKSFAKAHCETLPISWTCDKLDDRLEIMSQIFDDYELFLMRASGESFREAFLLLDRIGHKSLQIILDLPGFSLCNKDIRAFKHVLIDSGWLYKNSLQLDDMLDYDEDSGLGNGEEVEDDLEEIFAKTADLFQSIYQLSGDVQSNSEDFSRLLHEYLTRLKIIFNSDLDRASLGPIAYFQWKFIHLAVEMHYLGRTGSSISKLLFSNIGEITSWTKSVEKAIPARYLVANSSNDELDDCATQVINFMQKLC